MKKTIKAKEPVKIRFKELANGNKSIYLDIYSDGKRRYEFLKLYIIPGKDPTTAVKNENAMTAARAIQAQRIIEFANGKAGIKQTKTAKVTLLEWIKTNYPNDKHVKGVYLHLQLFMGGKDCALSKVDKDFCLNFINYLSSANKVNMKEPHPLSKGSARIYFKRFTKVLNDAVRKGIITENPVHYLDRTEKSCVNGRSAERCFLSANEVALMEKTEVKRKSVKMAFLFACYSGLRLSDICSLVWGDLKMIDGTWFVVKRMKKTGEIVSVPLDLAQRWLPNRDGAKDSDLIFDMPSTNKRIGEILDKWAKDAGINKHVTFHTSRHTFATMLLTAGADLYTTSKLLGHANISTTQIYAKIVDAKKVDAIKLLSKMCE